MKVCMSPLLFLILSEMKSVHSHPPYLFICFNIILQSTSWSSKWSLSFKSTYPNYYNKNKDQRSYETRKYNKTTLTKQQVYVHSQDYTKSKSFVFIVFSPMRATSSANFIVDLMTLIMFGDDWNLWSSSLHRFLQHPVVSSAFAGEQFSQVRLACFLSSR
jgi:hypothetical protein